MGTARDAMRRDGLRSIWYRSSTTFQFPPELSDAERQHAFLEAKYGLGGVLSSLPVLWVNHPVRVAAASKPVQLSTAVSEGVRRFLGALGLTYGALDFVVSPDGSYTFLECNAGGQFGWLEARTGAPLTDALADLLTRGARP